MKYIGSLKLSTVICTLALGGSFAVTEASSHGSPANAERAERPITVVDAALGSLDLIDRSNRAAIEEANLGIVRSDGVTTRWRGTWPLLNEDATLLPGEVCYIHAAGYEIMTLNRDQLLKNPVIELAPIQSGPGTLRLLKSVDLTRNNISVRGGLVCQGHHWRRADPALRFRSPVAVEHNFDASESLSSFKIPMGAELRLGLYCDDLILAPEFVTLEAGTERSVEAIPYRELTLTGPGAPLITAYAMTPDTRFGQGFGDAARGPFHRFIAMPRVAELSSEPGVTGWTHVPPIRMNVLFQVDGRLNFEQLPEGIDAIEIDRRQVMFSNVEAWDRPLHTGPGVFLPGHLDLSSGLVISRELKTTGNGLIRVRDAATFTGRFAWQSTSSNFTFLSDSGEMAYGAVDAEGRAHLDSLPGGIDVEFEESTQFSGTVKLESRWSPYDGVAIRSRGRELTIRGKSIDSCAFKSLPLGSYLIHIDGELTLSDGTERKHVEQRWVTLTSECPQK